MNTLILIMISFYLDWRIGLASIGISIISILLAISAKKRESELLIKAIEQFEKEYKNKEKQNE